MELVMLPARLAGGSCISMVAMMLIEYLRLQRYCAHRSHTGMSFKKRDVYTLPVRFISRFHTWVI